MGKEGGPQLAVTGTSLDLNRLLDWVGGAGRPVVDSCNTDLSSARIVKAKGGGWEKIGLFVTFWACLDLPVRSLTGF